MNEGIETSVPRKRYLHWIVLGCVVLLALSLELLPDDLSPSHGGVSSKAKTDISAIVQSLEEYSNNNAGKYPETLQPLVTQDTNGRCYLEGYNQRIPRDPWKREYLYDAPTPEHPKPRVRSLGSDGKPGGGGTAKDIDSDHLLEESR